MPELPDHGRAGRATMAVAALDAARRDGRLRRLRGAVCGGFFWFVHHVPAEEVALDRNADGIVVLTGGASRINDAIELLAAGRGQRLLISGVNRTTRRRDRAPESALRALVACCVDFDIRHQHARQRGRDAALGEERGFTSLIVVTSGYHMPRAMAELAHQLPGRDADPVSGGHREAAGRAVVGERATARLIFSEYLKFLVAQFACGSSRRR